MTITVYSATISYGTFHGVVLAFTPIPEIGGSGKQGRMSMAPAGFVARIEVSDECVLRDDGTLASPTGVVVSPDVLLRIAESGESPRVRLLDR